MLAILPADCELESSGGGVSAPAGVSATRSAGVVGQVLPAGPCCVQLGGRASELADSASLLGGIVSEELFGGRSSVSTGVAGLADLALASKELLRESAYSSGIALQTSTADSGSPACCSSLC